MITDIRFAVRQLLSSPTFTLVAALTLAIGIGANTAIFSLINAFLLKPLPFPDSDRLLEINLKPSAAAGSFAPMSGGIFLDIKDCDQFESISLYRSSSLNLTGFETPTRLTGLEVSPNYLQTLGLPVAMGQDFLQEGSAERGDLRVVLLSNRLWQNQFESDPSVIGTVVTLDYEPYKIIGVLRPDTFVFQGFDYMVPSTLEQDPHRMQRRYNYVCGIEGRLKPGATPESAEAALGAIKSSLNDLYPDMMKEWGVATRTVQEAAVGNSRPYIIILLAAVGMVLLVACANVANLLIAKATARQGEIAVRSALGASSMDITRQLLIESVLLAGLGGILGLCIGILTLKPLAILLDLDQLPNISLDVDPSVLIFTASISVLTGLIFGTFPAAKLLRSSTAGTLKDSSRSATSGGGLRIQSALIVAEITLSVMLLVAIGLMARSLAKAFSVDPGFESANVLTFELARSNKKSPTKESLVRFTDQILGRLEQIPGVVSAAMISTTPMNGNTNYGAPFWRDDQPDNANQYFTGFDSVNGAIFKTLGIPLLSGRLFTPFDHTENAPNTLIISKSVADKQFPDKDPIGQMVHHDSELWEVVGVVGDIHRFALDNSNQATVYKPQGKWPWNSAYVIKTSLAPMELADEVRHAMADVDPDQPIDRVRTLDEAVAGSLDGRRTMITLIGLFGVIAIFLAAIGIYGLTSYMVEQRNREFGIRLAIGAFPGEIISMVLKRGIILAVGGTLLGAALSLALGRFLAILLFDVQPFDPLVLTIVTLVTLLVTIAACWRPAHSASQLNPSTALRAD